MNEWPRKYSITFHDFGGQPFKKELDKDRERKSEGEMDGDYFVYEAARSTHVTAPLTHI